MRTNLFLTVLATMTLTQAALAGSTEDYIGTYKAVGECKMVNGNRSIATMEIGKAYQWTELPEGSLAIIFREPKPWNLYYFSTYVIPGSGDVKDPDSNPQDPTYMTHFTETKDGLISINIHHSKHYGDRTEKIEITPSSMGGPIWKMKYTTGSYQNLDECEFVKVSAN